MRVGDDRDEVITWQTENSHEVLDETATKRSSPAKRVFLGWWPEIVWCVFAITLLVVLAGLLNAFDKQPSPEWPVSLNTAVAAISTICRAAMVIPVSEGLSQLKWNAFARSQRPLNDLRTFDQASRGPFGSLSLLSKARGRLLGVSTIAALILISGLATSSLTQATITSGPPLRRLTEKAVAKKSSAVTKDDMATLFDPFRSAIFQSFFIDKKQRESLQLNPTCPTSCHWNKFRSIDICDVQRNVTDQLKIQQLKYPDDLGDWGSSNPGSYGRNDPISSYKAEFWRITLGEEFQLDNTNFGNWVASTRPLTGYWAKDIWGDDRDQFPLTALSTQLYIYKKMPYVDVTPPRTLPSYKGDVNPYRAVAVTWYWCIKEYEIDISSGVTHIKATETDFKAVNDSASYDNTMDKHFILVDNATSERFPLLLGPWSLEAYWTGGPWLKETDGMSSTAAERIIGNSTSMEDDPWVNIKTWKDASTLAMSALVRSVNTTEGNQVQGYAEIKQPTIIIRWEWLSLLVIQIALMIAFMIYVIWETSRLDVQIVKGSNIAELKAIGQEISSRGSERVLFGGIAEKVDADLLGRLVKNDEGWSLKVDRRSAC